MKTVGYLIHDPKNFSPEEEAGWKFLSSVKSYRSKKVNFRSIGNEKSLRAYDLLWWHYDSSVAIPDVALDPLLRLSLKHYVERGGSLFLSLLAAQYVADMNFDEMRPNLIEKGLWQQESWAKEYPDIRGFASFQGHPIFKGLSGGSYTWNPRVGTEYAAAVYNETTPKTGSVVAIERLYIKLNENWRIITEHAVKKGRVLSIGTFLFFHEQNHRFRKHLETLSLNCFSYLTENQKTKSRKSYWNFVERTVTPFSHAGKPLPKPATSWQTRPNGIVIKRELNQGDEEQFFDVGGRRTLVMGKERGGISEAWCHPVRILKDLRIGLKVGSGETVWTSSLNPQVVIEPESLTRVYHIGETMVEEVVFSDEKLPVGGIHLRVDSRQPVEIIVAAVVDLRLMWPLSDRATGSLRFAWDKNLRASVIMNGDGDLVSLLGSSLEPSEQRIGQYKGVEESVGRLTGDTTDAIQVAVGLRYSLSQSQPQCTIAFSGSHNGEREAVEAYRGFLQDSARVLRSHAGYFDRLFGNSTLIVSPDQEFNDGFRWAMAAADRFFVNTPGVGQSFMAGYGFSSSGWDGGQKISGRPGYAWYFGRDSVWTSFAALDYGDFEKVRRVLEFLGRYQDLDGKVLHELTSSGYAHYDAADSTPLYIILMGRYLRATADTLFVRKEFERFRKAVSFCYSTDTDGDHLIENTNVGHGWVEGGGLFPVHTEHYLASCWSAALREASYVADALKQKPLSQKWSQESRKVQETILDEFWNSETEFYNFAKRADKTFSKEKTILPAVGMYFGIAEHGKAEKCLEEYASSNFSSDWGTRIIRKDNPMYNPQGYHYGSVWPLFTGWTSLAEFRWNRPVQGFIHAMNNLLVFEHFAGGYVEEVMQGEKFQPAGVCPHQAWSETMVLQPLLEGMLGLRMNALRNELTLRPYFPCTWPKAEVRNIRVGRNRISLTMRREKNSTVFRFRSVDSKPVRMVFQPWFPLGTVVSQVRVGNDVRAKNVVVEQLVDAPTVEFTLSKPVTLNYRHRGGLAIVPPVPRPVPNQESGGLRFIDEQWDGHNWILTVEGREGVNYELEVMDFSSAVKSVQRAAISHRDGPKIFLTVTISGTTGVYQKHVIVCQT